MKKNRKPRLCLVSSSGGHWEDLTKLKPLLEKYDGFFVTEKTKYPSFAEYLLIATDMRDKWMPIKMLFNGAKTLCIWALRRPDYVITTGTLVAYPFYFLAVLFRKKIIFVESFGLFRPTVAAKKMEKHADLMIVQWEELVPQLKNAVYGGSLH